MIQHVKIPIPAAVLWDWVLRSTVPLTVFLAGWMIKSEIRAQGQEARIALIEKHDDEQTVTLGKILDNLTAIRETMARLEERSTHTGK